MLGGVAASSRRYRPEISPLSRLCHFSDSGGRVLDVRAKCPRFSRVHFSDREADSVSINYAGRFAGPIFIYSSRTDGREKGADRLSRPWAKGRTTGSERREPFVLRAEGGVRERVGRTREV